MNNNINIISIEGITMYTCKKCDEMSKRRYNIERHFRRFHETILPGKTCCDVTFVTKGDFYKHRETIHEQKKYTKGRYQNSSKTKQGITVFTKRNLYKRKEKNGKKNIHKKEEYTKRQKRKTSKIESFEVEQGTFFTTNDFYEEKKEKEKTHNEKKKYTKRQNRKTSKTKFSEVKQRETLIDTHMELSETQNNNKNVQLLHENLNAPKKQFLYKWQKNSSHQLHTKSRRAPLTNMKNDTSRRTAMKHASQKKIKKLNFLNLDKENIKVYNITDHSNEGIHKGLNSIIF